MPPISGIGGLRSLPQQQQQLAPGPGGGVMMPTFDMQYDLSGIGGGRPGMGTYQGSAFPFLGFGAQQVTLPVMGGGAGYGGGGGAPPVDPNIAQRLINETQQAYLEGRQANESRYNELVNGRNQLQGRIMGSLGDYGAQELEDINRDYDHLRSSARADLVNRGLSNSTLTSSVDRGVMEDRHNAIGRARDRQLQYRTGLDMQLAENVFGTIERREDEYPDFNDYANLLLQFGRYGGMGGGGYGAAGGGAAGGGALGPSQTSYGPGYSQTQTLIPPSGGSFPGSSSNPHMPRGYGWYQQALNNPSDYGYSYGGSGYGGVSPWIQTGNGLVRNPAYGGSVS